MNNDLISREALKKAMRKAKKGYYSAFSDVTLQSIYKVIDNAPTVDVTALCPVDFPTADDPYPCCSYKRPRGEWEEPFERNGKTYHKCNHCHISSELILIDNYCPNCGAEMRGEKK